jgi:uncharacterized membrane protein
MDPITNIGTDNGKNVGIVSYLTFIGWLIAYFGMHQNNKTSLGSYQLRQTLLLYIAYFVVRWGLSIILGIFWLASSGFFSLYSLLWLVNIAFFILWLIGFIGAVNGEKKPIPIFGEWAQTMFSGI